ncbi:hypothetical protein CPT03_07045 [Pedobacter ginsengisoli]|uniref:Uncharacterized protein n=1 Tax=Pedobacter ginsengisoli TaxID=363852 RepID=A0A2D1U3S4_9SPHI|nr:hypothetical protein [Pedobacter ginsengisoli]ATP56241.1 hypothetical protein CPT03_07045 [Pedobacter ginsengisoli]
MQEIPLEELITKGEMSKLPFDMTLAERIRWQLELQEDAKEYLFSIGQPLVYKKNGQMIAEHADGRIIVIR